MEIIEGSSIHSAFKESEENECKFKHGPYLFMSNGSWDSQDNRTYCNCICLRCGRMDSYYLSKYERRHETIYTKMSNKFDIINEFYKIRENLCNIPEEDTILMIDQINYEYTGKTRMLKKQ
jgi:hypothetical protein